MVFRESTIVAGHAGFFELRHVKVTGSTNSDLAAESRRGVTTPVVLVADHQTAGRGRLDREWFDEGDSLLVSMRMACSADDAHRIMDAVAAAARHAVAQRITEEVLFKWPNDLVIVRNGELLKLGGLLAEWIDSDPPVVVVGVGINIGPSTIDEPTASVSESGGVVSRDRLLEGIISAMAPRLADPEFVAGEMKSNNATVGRRVKVSLPGGRVIVGLATGLASGGCLQVADDSGAVHEVSAGDVVHLRSAELS